jgi:hypothetical protein
LAKPDHEFFFAVRRTATGVIGDIETRITLFTRVALSIQALILESMPSSSGIDTSVSLLSSPPALKIENWLPYLSMGPLGRADDAGIIAQTGASDFVVFGPYWPLPAGYYQAVIDIERKSELRSSKHLIRADIVMADRQLVGANFHLDAQCAKTTIRLPFEVGGNSLNWRQIQTRIWSSGDERFRIRALSVKPLEQSGRRDLLPFLLLSEIGRRVRSGIRNGEGLSGIVAYCPNIGASPGSYRMTLAAQVTPIDQADGRGQECAVALVKYGTEILAVGEIKSTSSHVNEQQFLFEVPSDQDRVSGVELFFQVPHAVTIDLRTLTIEHVETKPQLRCHAVLGIPDWLPFLRNGKSARAREGGILVTEGVEELAVYGPCWTLPAGRYEMRALVVPNPQGRDRGAVVTAQVTAEEGTRTFVEGKWRLGQYKVIDAAPAVEFRLPFSLSGDLSPVARTIETRIFTPGDASFRILSLAVRAKSDEPEVNWFPYLLVGECGVHTGDEIKVVKDKTGSIARTPPMRVVPGHYRVSPDMAVDGGVAFEAWCGSDLIAIETMNSGTERLEFDVTDEHSVKDVELRIYATAPTELSIRGLNVEKISDPIGSQAPPAILRLKDWLPFLELGAAARRVGRSVLARYAQSGYVVYGPYWPLPAGEYVMLVAVELDETEKAPAGTRLQPKNLIKALLLFARVLRDGEADVMLDGRRIALVGGFTIGSFFSRSTSISLPFEIAVNDVEIGSRLETRVWSTGRRGFRIRGVTVRRRMRNERIYKRKNWALFRLMRAKLVDMVRGPAR